VRDNRQGGKYTGEEAKCIETRTKFQALPDVNNVIVDLGRKFVSAKHYRKLHLNEFAIKVVYVKRQTCLLGIAGEGFWS